MASRVVAIASSGEALRLEGTELTTAGSSGVPVLVGEAREATPAHYLLYGSERTVLCLNATDTVIDYQYDQDEDEWAPGNISALGIKAHPGTKITALVYQEDCHAFFQEPSGKLQELVRRGEGGQWRLGSTLENAKPGPGSSIAVVEHGGAIHLVYVHQDMSIHHITLKEDSPTDIVLKGTDDGLPKGCLLATSRAGEMVVEFANSSGEIFAVVKNEAVKIGDVTEKGIAPVSSAEAWWGGGFSSFSSISSWGSYGGGFGPYGGFGGYSGGYTITSGYGGWGGWGW